MEVAAACPEPGARKSFVKYIFVFQELTLPRRTQLTHSLLAVTLNRPNQTLRVSEDQESARICSMTRPQAQARRPAQLKQRPQAQKTKLQQQRKMLRPVGKAAGANTGKRLMTPPSTLNERFARLQQQRKAMLQTPKVVVRAAQKRRPLKKQVCSGAAAARRCFLLALLAVIKQSKLTDHCCCPPWLRFPCNPVELRSLLLAALSRRRGGSGGVAALSN